MWVLLGNPSSPPRAKGDLPPLLLRLTNFLGYLFLILVNILSSTGALGETNAEVSAKYPTPLTPSGWAFAIWGLIFALQGLGVVYQILNKGYREGGWKASVVNKIGYGWQLGWLFQNLWQFAFTRQSMAGMWLSAAALLAALAAFQHTLQRLNGTTHELRARGYAAMPAAAYICYKLPTSVNAAWLSVATALGLLIVPVSYGVEPARLVAPAAVLAVAVTAGGVWRLLSHRDAAYGLTLIWALSAVASNTSGNVPTAVKVVGMICLVVLALCVVSALVRTRRDMASAAASATAGVDGSLLYDTYNMYGSSSYGAQRIPLSDSDSAPAGYGRAPYSSGGGGGGGDGTYGFPAAFGNNGGGVPNGSCSHAATHEEALGVGGGMGRKPFLPPLPQQGAIPAGYDVATAGTVAVAAAPGVRGLPPVGPVQGGGGVVGGSETPRLLGSGVGGGMGAVEVRPGSIGSGSDVGPARGAVGGGGARRVRFSDEEEASGQR
ncbi:hypothetical protein Agub_g12941 [Astrephomene gubernaculifera]|uniref:Uncharacterized protein n=1 Tax=Astrephomene gubernaculifera TaxID=47775 RepID=A0AAD3HR24_9CHLO|nr:hypothetical protein Agub_g12941 [Astrephomene gubernaculifera]